MRSLLLLIVMMGVCAAPAFADAPPRNCTEVPQTDREKQANIIGYAQISEIKCRCETAPSCTKSVRLLDIKKGGMVPYIITLSEPLDLAPDADEADCHRAAKEKQKAVGEEKTFYFKKTKTGIEEVPEVLCDK